MKPCKSLLITFFSVLLLAAGASAQQKITVRADIVSVAPAGGDTVLHLNRGSRHGLRKGMTGDVDGLKADATIIKINGRRSQALVKTEPRHAEGKRQVVFSF